MQHCAPIVALPHFNAKVVRIALCEVKASLYVNLVSQIPFAPSDFSSLNSTQFLSPTWSRLHLLDGTQLVGSVARHAEVVVALENELEVAKLES